MVKDCYVLPVAKLEAVPPGLLDPEEDLLNGRTDCLLCMIVRTRRERGGGSFSSPADGGRTPASVAPGAANRVPATAPSLYKTSVQYKSVQPAAATLKSLPGSQLKPAAGRPSVAPVLSTSLEDDEPYEPDDLEPYSPGGSPVAVLPGPSAGYSTGKSLPARVESPPLIR